MQSHNLFEFFPLLFTVLVAYERALQSVFFRFPPAPIAEYYDLYIALNPFVTHVFICIALVFIQVFVFTSSSKRLERSSKLSACLPLLLACMYLFHAPLSQDRRVHGDADNRICLLAILVAAWTLNHFSMTRTAGQEFEGEEFYRLLAFRQRFGSVVWILASLHITVAKSVAFSLLMIPLYFAWQVRGSPLSNYEVLGAGLFVACIAFRRAASYQRREAALRTAKNSLTASGIFAWLRQPELLAEILTWWVFYAFAVLQTGTVFHWSAVGPLLHTCLSALWQAVAEWNSTELSTFEKNYRAHVWMLLPWPPRPTTSNAQFSVKKTQ